MKVKIAISAVDCTRIETDIKGSSYHEVSIYLDEYGPFRQRLPHAVVNNLIHKMNNDAGVITRSYALITNEA